MRTKEVEREIVITGRITDGRRHNLAPHMDDSRGFTFCEVTIQALVVTLSAEEFH